MERFIIKCGGRYLGKASTLENFVFTPLIGAAKIFEDYNIMFTSFVEVLQMNPKAEFQEVTMVYSGGKLKRRKDFDLMRRHCPEHRMVKDFAAEKNLEYLLEFDKMIEAI